MKLILIFLLSLFAACSGDVENKKAPELKSKSIESKPVNPVRSQSNPVEEHISGGGQTRISGAPSTTHISGQ